MLDDISHLSADDDKHTRGSLSPKKGEAESSGTLHIP